MAGSKSDSANVKPVRTSMLDRFEGATGSTGLCSGIGCEALASQPMVADAKTGRCGDTAATRL